MKRPSALKVPSKLDRVPRRLAQGTEDASTLRIDKTGGLYGAGLINRVSLCSRGEALGHGFWIDDVMLRQIVELAKGHKLKSRFTHPDWCEDGTGKYLGRIMDLELDGDQVYGDLSFCDAAHRAPDGDLADYVMDLAKEDPEAFGLSIVFSHDREAEELFYAEHCETIELTDSEGNIVDSFEQFVSPDPLNVENLPHARLAQLHAADVVDDPAANPNGLFHRANQFAAEGRGVLDYILGRSTEPPKLAALDIAPERLKSFVARYLANAGLTIEGVEDMPKTKGSLTSALKKTAPKADPKLSSEPEKKDGDAAPKDEKKDPPADDEGDDDETNADSEPKPKEEPADDESEGKGCDEQMRSGLKAFCEAFGNERGAEYFLKGLDFSEALTAEVITLREQLAKANEKLEAFAKLGVDPVKFNAAPDKSKGGNGTTSGDAPVSNHEKFAALNQSTEEKK